MYQNNLYMIMHVDQVQKKVQLQKYPFQKQVIINVSTEEAIMYAQLLEETSENESVLFVEYDEKRGMICL
ncbi:hypothetical protein COE50_06095 [Bacillus anthracis]|nr:hypothetical protein COE50_06095 [Bacillus anthracis]